MTVIGYTMGSQLHTLLLLMSTCTVLGADEMQIVSTSGEHVLVKEGGVANLSCRTDQEWFFCLWRHPSGVKECIVQENMTYASACAGSEHLDIQGSSKFCSLQIENVSLNDHGKFMCLLNQADIFHTEREFVTLEVATPAHIILGRNQSVLDLVEGEIVHLECEGRRAFTEPIFQWSGPGLTKVSSKQVCKSIR